MDGQCHNDELSGYTARELEEITKRQELREKHYIETVCVNCPTKNCLKKENESDVDYGARKMAVSMRCNNNNALAYMDYELYGTIPQEELIWENCMWNKKDNVTKSDNSNDMSTWLSALAILWASNMKKD